MGEMNDGRSKIDAFGDRSNENSRKGKIINNKRRSGGGRQIDI